MPVIIPGARKKLPPRSTIPVETKHRALLHASVVVVLAVFILTTLVTFLPLGKEGKALGLGGLLQNLGVMKLINSDSRNTVLVGAQAATATAIMQQDGYDPGKAVSAQYNAALGVDATGNNFPYGQCTYWASSRYHELAGYWVPWSGNAYQWAYNAPAYAGWVVSGTPHVPSIVVFQPGVQYSSSTYGHVAVLESINADGSLHTSNMNVYGHAFGTRADMTNYAGSGVSFVYHV
jgi:surface antigen